MVGGAADRFWAELRDLHERAGRPTLARLVRAGRDGGHRVSDATINDWLTGGSIPAATSVPYFLRVLVPFLLRRARERDPGAHLPAERAWQDLVTAAQAERAANRGGRRRGATRRGDAGPVTLPALPERFTGRTELVGELLEWLDPAGTHGGVTVVSAADGMGGVGKTALAVHVAGLVLRRGWFPGGALFEDLRGFSTDEPLAQGVVAGRLLRALGVPDNQVPEAAPDRVRRWRDQLRRLGEQGRPVLVVLDNAESAAQVAQLVPDHPHRMLVTSRRTLAAVGARRIQVRPFAPAEAVAFLGSALRTSHPGDERVERAPDDARRLAELCGWLPLALRIVVALLRDEPGRPLADLVAELADARTRLARLRYDDVDEHGRPLGVLAAFDLSYTRLVADPERARAFRLLACVPGPDVALGTAAAMLDRPVVTTRRLLADLARVSLADHGQGRRWRMHDLVRLYARQRSDEHAGEDGRERALDLLLGYYEDVVGQVDGWLYDREAARTGTFGSRDEAVAWLDAERACVVAAIAEAHESRRWATAHRLVSAVSGYLEFRYRPDEAVAVGTLDVSAAAHLGRRAECGALVNLGNGYRLAGRHPEAVRVLERARDLATGDEELAGRLGSILHDLGLVYFRSGRFTDAVACHERDLELCRAARDLRGAAQAMVALGDALRGCRRYRDAAARVNQAILIFDGLGEVTGLMGARTNLALICLDGYSGRAAYTVWQLCLALRAARDLGDAYGQASVLVNLGPAFLKRCRGCHADAAVWSAQRAEVMFRGLGDDRGVALARDQLRTARPLAEHPTAEDHQGCPEDGMPDARHRVAWLNDLPHAVLRGDDRRLDEARFVGNAMVGPTPDGSVLPPELLARNRLGLLLDGADQPADESVDFLCAHTRLTGGESLEVGVFLGNHADVVAMAAAHLNRHRLTGAAYLERLDETRLGGYSPAGSSHPHTVGAAKAAMLTIRAAEEQGAHVRTVLEFAALLAPGLLDHLGPVSGLPAGDLEAAMGVLAEAAVFTGGPDPAPVMSPVTQQVVLHRAAHHGRLLDVAATVTEVLGAEVESVIGVPTERAEVERLVRQVDTVWAAVRPVLGSTDASLAAALLRLRGVGVNVCITDGEQRAVPMAEAVLDDCERWLGPTHGETWRARNNLAGACGFTGDPDRACALLAANLRVMTAGDEHRDTLLTRHNLGVMQSLAGRPTRAVRVLEQVLADSERVLGADDPITTETQRWLTIARDRATGCASGAARPGRWSRV